MRRLQRQFVKALLISSVVGCGFSPGAPGESLTRRRCEFRKRHRRRHGAGGVNGNGTGIGLTSGARRRRRHAAPAA